MKSGAGNLANNTSSYFYAGSLEQKLLFNLDDAISKPLPAPLSDKRQDASFISSLTSIQKLVKGSISRDQLFTPILSDKRHLICSFTQLLMVDPVRHIQNGRAYEREAYEAKTIFGDRKNLIPATDIANEISDLLLKFPRLKNLQYVTHHHIVEMANACEQGAEDNIRKLYNLNSLLILMPEPNSKWVPLQHAVQNERSIGLVIELLDKRLPGLALVSLLQPDQSGRLPLEAALRYGTLSTILHIMAWMGDDELASFRLTGPLPPKKQLLLDKLLFACIVREKAEWAKKTLFWGANLSAVVNDQNVLIDAPDKKVNKKILDELYSLWNAFSDPFPILTEPKNDDIDDIVIINSPH